MPHGQHAVLSALRRYGIFSVRHPTWSTSSLPVICLALARLFACPPVCLPACVIDSSALLYGFTRLVVCIVVVLFAWVIFVAFFFGEGSRKKENCVSDFSGFVLPFCDVVFSCLNFFFNSGFFFCGRRGCFFRIGFVLWSWKCFFFSISLYILFFNVPLPLWNAPLFRKIHLPFAFFLWFDLVK